MKKNTIKIYIFIIISILIISVVGMTYAFFYLGVLNEGASGVTYELSDTAHLKFAKGQDIDMLAGVSNLSKDGEDLITTTTASVTLTAESDYTSLYYVYYEIINNDFMYTTEEEIAELVLVIKRPDGSYVTEIEGLEYVVSGDITGFDVTIADGIFEIAVPTLISLDYTGGEDSVTLEWEFILYLRNLETNQGANALKIFESEIILSTEETNLDEYQYFYEYTGDYQTFTVEKKGTYLIELWGASGSGTYAAYVSGEINLKKEEELYIYVGQSGVGIQSAFNSGGTGYTTSSGTGGGATDIRLVSGSWNNSSGLSSRIMVAGGAGGASEDNLYVYGNAGGLIGYTAYNTTYAAYTSTGGTQISGGIVNNYNSSYTAGTNGSFGVSGNGGGASGDGSPGGGGGYYGASGGSRLLSGLFPSGGGSSFISGHTGCVAINSETNQTPISGCTTGTTDTTCSLHYSGYTFENTIMIDGAGYTWTNIIGQQVNMPSTTDGYYDFGIGHSGDGYARITLIR